MNGKLSRRLRKQAISTCLYAARDFQERSAPTVVGNLPAYSLLKWTQTGQMMCPAETGRFWYQRLKRAYRGFRLGGALEADRINATMSDLAYRLIIRITPEASKSNGL